MSVPVSALRGRGWGERGMEGGDRQTPDRQLASSSPHFVVDEGNDDNGCSHTFATVGSATVYANTNSKHGRSIITFIISLATSFKIARNNDIMLSLLCIFSITAIIFTLENH